MTFVTGQRNSQEECAALWQQLSAVIRTLVTESTAVRQIEGKSSKRKSTAGKQIITSADSVRPTDTAQASSAPGRQSLPEPAAIPAVDQAVALADFDLPATPAHPLDPDFPVAGSPKPLADINADFVRNPSQRF